MNDDEEEFVETDIASYDQYHAEAIDRLREADTFILAIPAEIEEDNMGGGMIRIQIMGGGDRFDVFRHAVTHGMVRSAMREEGIDFNWGDARRGTITAKRAMWAAAALNLCCAAFTMTLLVVR